jgi:chromosome segregation ATPase
MPALASTVLPETEVRIADYRRLLNSIIARIDRLLEFATDPAMNLAEEIRKLQGERDAAVAPVNKVRAERDTAVAELHKRDSMLAELRRLIARRDLTLMELRKELKAQEAAQANAIKSMKGELAKQKQLFERKIEELEKQHRKELKIVEARSQIELNELRKKMEQREMKREEAVDKQSDQRDQFADLLPNYSSPRAATSPGHEKKAHRKPTSRK